MGKRKWITAYALLAMSPLFAIVPAQAASPGILKSYSTIHSIGIEWNLTGDTNHDAVATVQYRRAGDSTWKPALPLVRVDYNGFNMLAGSILFLEPGATYDIVLELSDPDGGGETRTISVATRPRPALPIAGRTFHVRPGSGGGTGTSGDPFRGVATAQAVAQAGDTFLLHGGAYGGGITFEKSGEMSNYVVWKAFGDGEPVFGAVTVSGDWIWLEGLRIENQPNGLTSSSSPQGVVVTRCVFVNNHYGIRLNGGGAYWYIADNDISGDTALNSGSFSGEGIELEHTDGHTVAHNRITRTADGISYPNVNVDIFGNDIFDTSDDGIEGDYGLANIRIWGNRIHNAVHNGISFQTQDGAPWYIIRNQIVNSEESIFKFRGGDRFLVLHNTLVNWNRVFDHWAEYMLNATSRNNIYVSLQGSRIWDLGSEPITWRTDLDYDGFDWGQNGAPFAHDGQNFSGVSSLHAATGQEAHGLRFDRATCLANLDVPGAPPTPVPAQHITLRAGCALIDAGAILPNINDNYAGNAPDLGAFEMGAALAAYGPRPPRDTSAPASPTGLRVN